MLISRFLDDMQNICMINGYANISSSQQLGNMLCISDQQRAYFANFKLPPNLCQTNSNSFKDCISMIWSTRKEEKKMDILQDQDCKKLVRENLPEMQINQFFVILWCCNWSFWKLFYSRNLSSRHKLEARVLPPLSCPLHHKQRNKKAIDIVIWIFIQRNIII